MRICVAYCSRADKAPLGPVIRALHRVDELYLPGVPDFNVGYANSALVAAERFRSNHYHWLIVLGDRYEIHACAGAAVINSIPIAHIHGGEITLGSFDDRFRNAISMLASIHFVSAELYGARLRNMGVSGNVHVVGAPGLDNIKEIRPHEGKRFFVVTYHPATRANESVTPLLQALDRFPDHDIVFTGVNNDPGAAQISDEIMRARGRVIQLPPSEYLSMCANADAVIGNSSSGLIEVPSLGTPTVDIGDRQKGRLAGDSVFHALPTTESIYQCIKLALAHRGPYRNPHHGPGASKRIAEILSK